MPRALMTHRWEVPLRAREDKYGALATPKKSLRYTSYTCIHYQSFTNSLLCFWQEEIGQTASIE